jgi:tetratricopeptide (TPR) repeat protein
VLWVDGKNDEAVSQFETAVDINPHDFKSMGFIARIDASKGDIEGAKTWALKSIAVAPTVEVATLMEDISTQQGNSEDAGKYQTLVDMVSHPDMYKFLQDPTQMPKAAKPHTHDRLYAMYLADHKRNLPDALAAAKKDLNARQDIYAFDTMAWVLHQMGRDTEAKPMMNKALARGTQDAKLFYHAGLIERALGNSALAGKELSKALAINPDFQFGQSQLAKADLKSMGGAQSK